MRRLIARELMDEPVDDLAELEANLRDIAFANAVFGGTAPILRALRRSGARRVLDVGSGLADVPLALLRDGRRRGVELHVTCVDRSVQMLALARRPRLLILDEPTSGFDPVARQEVLTEFMDVLRDEDRSILFSSHNTLDVERISDRIAFIDRGRLVECSDKEDFLERWRRIELQVPAGQTPPALPDMVSRVVDGQFVTLTTNRFSEQALASLGPTVRAVQRMSLEEIFVATVFHHREALGQ